MCIRDRYVEAYRLSGGKHGGLYRLPLVPWDTPLTVTSIKIRMTRHTYEVDRNVDTIFRLFDNVFVCIYITLFTE